MKLSRNKLEKLTTNETWSVPNDSVFELPEKVLQFGTGVLLRGLPDFFIDKANKQGVFNGRVVIVKSTSSGDTNAFDEQDGLYTQCIRGIDKGVKVEQNIINASISRVLTAGEQWDEILECAANPDMEIILSNTTEVGISLDEEDKITMTPPNSFPGKLLAFLHRRFTIFNGDPTKGMVIVPTELISDNGKKLESIVLELAHLNQLAPAFMDWLETSNHFCNSLVDRIVPGKLPEHEKHELEKEVGFTDDLMIMSEFYSLWAIETSDPKVAEKLSFSKADSGVVIAPNIEKFKELKLRLLNGTHTLSCGLAFLAGFDTVKAAMANEDMSAFVSDLMQKEIAPSIPYKVDQEEAIDFSEKVLDRFRNPQIEHSWLAITVQYSSKIRMRILPVLIQHYKESSIVPEHMALGFAAHILFMHGVHVNGKIYGEANGDKYHINDAQAELYTNYWKQYQGKELVNAILSDKTLWEMDLTELTGFADAVATKMEKLQAGQVLEAIREVNTENQMA